MKIILSVITAFVLFASSACAADWKTLADEAIGLLPPAVADLENKKDKSESDVYALTVIYYREYHHGKLKKLYTDHEKKMPESVVLKMLNGIILLREHRHRECGVLLRAMVREHPEFYPALIMLAHSNYLQKDFAGAYALARRLIDKKKELSRYHYAVSLLLAAGSKGIIAKNNLTQAIPAYFEVNRYLKETAKLMPDSPEVFYGQGSYHLLTPTVAGGDIDLAIKMLEKSRQLTPQNTQVYVRLAQAYRFKGDIPAYRKNIARALEIDPQDEVLLDYLSGEKVFLEQ